MSKPELVHEEGEYRIIKLEGQTTHLNLSIRFVLEKWTKNDSLGNKIWESVLNYNEDVEQPHVAYLMYEIYKLKEIERLKTL